MAPCVAVADDEGVDSWLGEGVAVDVGVPVGLPVAVADGVARCEGVPVLDWLRVGAPLGDWVSVPLCESDAVTV